MGTSVTLAPANIFNPCFLFLRTFIFHLRLKTESIKPITMNWFFPLFQTYHFFSKPKQRNRPMRFFVVKY